MTDTRPRPLEYSVLRKCIRSHQSILAEVPLGHAFSLPLPTLRFGRPGIAGFAAPVDRTAGNLRQSPPDRWWVADAADTRLLFYALTSSVPLSATAASWHTEDIQTSTDTIEEFEERVEALDAILSMAAVRFWDNLSAEHGEAIASAVEAVIAPPLLPPHRVLAEDFWSWLGR